MQLPFRNPQRPRSFSTQLFLTTGHAALHVSILTLVASCASPPPQSMTPEQERQARQLIRQQEETNRWTVPPPQFEKWPLPPGEVTVGELPLPKAPEAPPVQEPFPDNARDKTLYSFRAENLDIQSALAIFARANKLNIVPDRDVSGPVTVEIQDLPLERVMQALLEAHDYSWTDEGGLIRVRSTETRTFLVDYLRMSREGTGTSVVTLSSGASGGQGGGAGGGAGGGGGGGGFGGGGSGGGSGGGAGGGAGGSISGSSMNLNLKNQIEFWTELEEELGMLLTGGGKSRLAVDMTAGVIQVTDRPSAIRNIETFLSHLTDAITRQVDIEAKLYDVTLNDQFQFGIDWQHIIKSQGGNILLGGFPMVTSPSGQFQLKESSLTLAFANDNTQAILEALQEQGEVTVVSQPRLRTLNNQTAIMKVGRDEPFFNQVSQFITSDGGTISQSGDTLSIITVGTVLAITPQISTNGWISLDISPAITSLVETRTSPSGFSSAPVLDIKQTSTIVRVRDGQTIVMGGLIQTSTAENLRKIPLLGDIPMLGKLFRGQFSAKEKKELVIFLTPRIVPQRY